jgi:hypothetical protein
MELRDDPDSDHFPASPEQIEKAVGRFVEMGGQMQEQLITRCWEDPDEDAPVAPLFRPDDPGVFRGVIPVQVYVERVDTTRCDF